MTLKQRIIKVLEAKKYTYDDLVKYLGVAKADLDISFENNSIEIRTLELISKELRIPLYSFFRDYDYSFDYSKEAYYNVDIWKNNEAELKTELENMKKEIDQLKIRLAEKDMLLKALEIELKSKT